MDTTYKFELLSLKKIHPSGLNPRLEVDINHLNRLAQSIKEVGLLEPIIVRPVKTGYEIVVGERRYRALLQAGLEVAPAIIRQYSDEEVIQLNLVENVHREELSAVEKGKVCKYLLEKHAQKYPTQSALARMIGVSEDAVSAWLRTLEVVPEEVQSLVAPSTASGDVPVGKIDYKTAVKVGRSLDEPEKRAELIRHLAERKLPLKERRQVIEKVALDPEKPLEEVFQQVVEQPCELEFTALDKRAILEGKKNQTSTMSIPDPKIRTGAIVSAVVGEPNFANLRIVSIERKRLKYFDAGDAMHEGFRNLGEFVANWTHIYGEFDEEHLVYVIHFEVLREE